MFVPFATSKEVLLGYRQGSGCEEALGVLGGEHGCRGGQRLAVAPPARRGQGDKRLLAYPGQAKFSRRVF